ncbi:MAG: hypothetical protein R3224_01180 [Balneolaceae bacterium]|nr:hypothetical protein [Balneolaceae bacterium]
MHHSELSENNFKRISLINWFLCLPLTILFGWPFYYLCSYLEIGPLYAFPASFLFALPFMITILHGHVTMALGSAHRHHYYDWLVDHRFSYGLFFHRIFMKTRFRLLLLAGASLLFLLGLFL